MSGCSKSWKCCCLTVDRIGGGVCVYIHFFKRLIDAVLSFVGLIVLIPVFAVVAVLIKTDSKGPVFFVQERVGKNKKPFKIYKFRTMSTDCPANMPTHLLGNAGAYITPIGGFLRKFSIDELPQIWNILKGDMTIIGPRPALFNQTDLLELRDSNGSNALKPGLTGYAQIHGRDELPIDVKASLDGYYAKNVGFCLDFKCFFGTIFKVLKSDGVVEGMSSEEFTSKEEVLK